MKYVKTRRERIDEYHKLLKLNSDNDDVLNNLDEHINDFESREGIDYDFLDEDLNKLFGIMSGYEQMKLEGLFNKIKQQQEVIQVQHELITAQEIEIQKGWDVIKNYSPLFKIKS